MHGSRWMRSVVPLMALLFAPGGGAAQDAMPPAVDDVLAVRTLSDPRLSPGGGRVAFVVREADRSEGRFRTRIHVAATGTGGARPVTREALAARAPRWSPTGSRLAFLAQAGEGQGGGAQIWVLPVDGGDAYPLTRVAEGVRSFAWAPDGASLVFLAPVPRDAVLRAWEARRSERKDDARVVHAERRPMALWRIALEPGARAERLFTGDAGVREFALSPDGRRAAVTTNGSGLAEDATDLWLVDLADGRARPLTDRAGSESSPVFSPDGRSIAFRASLEPGLSYSQPQLYVVDVEGGEPRNLTAGFDRAVRAIHWPGGGRDIVFSAAVGAYEQVFRVDPANGAIRPVLDGDIVVRDFAVSPSGRELYAVLATATALEDLHAVDRRGRVRRITALNRPLEGRVDWARQEVVSWTGDDGLRIEGVLTYPHGYVEGRRYPLVLEIHGGPYSRVTNALPGRAFAQLWAARGYLVLQPNFRGSQGYGEAFGTANRGDLGGGDFRDIMAGVDAMIDRGLVDPERMGVTGGSYGGYMTNWIIGQTDRFAAAISLYGIFSLITDVSNSNIPNWELGYFGVYYWDDLHPYLAHSPMSFVREMTTPTLILHGEADDNTVVANSAEMYQALRLLGREVEFVLYPREGHGIASEPMHIVDKWHRMRRWFDERVLYRGRPEAVVHEVGDSVPALAGYAAEGWTLRVLGAREPRRYLGETGEYLEVELLLSRGADAAALELALTGAAADIRLERGGQTLVPAGVPLERLDGASLVTGPAQRVRLPERDGTVALLVSFPRPRAGSWKLRVAGFAPVAVRVEGAPPAVARTETTQRMTERAAFGRTQRNQTILSPRDQSS